MNRALVAGALAVALTIGGLAGHLALASGTGTSHTFYACVKDGSMIPASVVVDKTPACRGGAEPVSWNEAGPEGSVGPAGTSGSAGPTGATGPSGPQGSTGAAGPSGSAGPTGATGPPGAGGGVKTIAGLVTATGSLSAGHGVTAVRLDTGNYLLRFPAGTWPSFPAIVVSPFGSAGAFRVAQVDSVIAPADGSAAALVVMSSTVGTSTPVDAAFLFTATAS
jgi:hypothetical protein